MSKIITIQREDEELLTKKELCERILRCDEESAELHFLNKPSFPYIWFGNRKRYPKKLVEKWIEDNTHYC